MAALTDGTCAACGEPLSPATSYMTALGPVCGPCFARVQTQQDQMYRRTADLDASLTRSAKRLGRTHAGMWGVAVIVANQWAGLSAWLSAVLLIAVVGLTIGLLSRQRWAFLVALGLDGAGTFALLVWSGHRFMPSQDWPILLSAVFPLSLIALTWTLRAAYEGEHDLGVGRSPALKRWMLPVLALVALAGGAYWFLRPRPDPARELMRTALPAWQMVRMRPGSAPDGTAARELSASARPWPALVTTFETLDRVWPDMTAVRAAASSINRALVDSRLAYFVEVWPVAGKPFLLTYDLVAHVPWRVGARTVDVLRLRRLDTLNVELAYTGVTDEKGPPVVMLDRIEAGVARDLPTMYAKATKSRSPMLNAFDRAALERLRSALEARLGPGLAVAANALGERDRLLEEMRSRLHEGRVQLNAPDGFVLGKAWLSETEAQTGLTRPGGPLVLDTDLREVVRADEKLRDPATTTLLTDAVDLVALQTEAHEARHALDEVDPVGPPPPGLFAVMPDSSTLMIGMADKEVRAILGEIHDGPLPACVTLAGILRNVYGQGARSNAYFFAPLAILRQLDPDADRDPAEQLSMLCGVPDAELRRRIAGAWQTLYAAPMPPAARVSGR